MNSKLISYLLRHDRRIANLVDDNGFISSDELNEIIRQDKNYTLSEEQLISIADDPTTKKRFEYERRDSGKLYIRALNGHSFPLRANIFEPYNPSETDSSGSPKYIYHITNRGCISSIMSEGLKPMARQYVHLYENKSQIKLDLKRNSILEIGPVDEMIPETALFRSKNGYIVCPHVISPKYIRPSIDK